jgi:hypothetical protein
MLVGAQEVLCSNVFNRIALQTYPRDRFDRQRLFGALANLTALHFRHELRVSIAWSSCSSERGEIRVREILAEDTLNDKSRSTRLLIAMTAKEAKDSGVDNRRRFFREVNLALPPEAGIWR